MMIIDPYVFKKARIPGLPQFIGLGYAGDMWYSDSPLASEWHKSSNARLFASYSHTMGYYSNWSGGVAGNSDGTVLVAGGYAGSTGSHTLARSLDYGVTWSGLGKNVFTHNCADVVWTGNRFLAIGNRDSYMNHPAIQDNCMAYSNDGLSWTVIDAGFPQCRRLAVMPSGRIVLAQNTLNSTSYNAWPSMQYSDDDGATWTYAPIDIPAQEVPGGSYWHVGSLCVMSNGSLAMGVFPSGVTSSYQIMFHSVNGSAWTIKAPGVHSGGGEYTSGYINNNYYPRGVRGLCRSNGRLLAAGWCGTWYDGFFTGDFDYFYALENAFNALTWAQAESGVSPWTGSGTLLNADYVDICAGESCVVRLSAGSSSVPHLSTSVDGGLTWGGNMSSPAGGTEWMSRIFPIGSYNG